MFTLRRRLANVRSVQQITLSRCRQFSSTTPFKGKIVPFNLADIGEGITECEIVEIFVKEGDKVGQFDRICEVHSDKATVEITSRYDGMIKKIHHQQGDTALVGKPLVDIELEEQPDIPAITTEEKDGVTLKVTQPTEILPDHKPPISLFLTSDSTKVNQYVLATPAVRRIARENNLDLKNVVGSGKDGRVMKGDLLAFLSTERVESDCKAKPESPNEKVRLTAIQKAMFKSMTASLSIPHFVYSERIRMDNLARLRSIYNKHPLYKLDKVSYMPFLIKAYAMAAKQYPIVNARVNTEEDGIYWEKRESINVCVAVDTKDGLVVPNIKNVQNMSVKEIARSLSDIKTIAASGHWKPENLSGGTITLSNIGSIGGTSFSPVLFDGQVCIGAMGAIRKEFVIGEDGKPEIAQMMNVSFSGDHRLLDGATLARFVNTWKSYIETPETILF